MGVDASWLDPDARRLSERMACLDPADATTVEVDGVCTVQLRGGLIYRNTVYFDRSELLRASAAATSRK